MIRAPFIAFFAVLAAGCASTPDTAPAGCQVAGAEGGANVVSYGRPKPQSEMDQRFARADLARSGYRQDHMDAKPSATEDALRNCQP
jgi:hypothetical protein